jgi:TolB-like protein
MNDHQPVSPSADEVRSELERILESAAFANAGRLARLLRYVVERTLAGEGDQLKEYVLGVEVFDRGQHYDPRIDSIVRVEARRLRSKLDEYYRSPAAAVDVIISIPRGTYVPVFGRREPTKVDHPPAERDERFLSQPAVIGLAAATVLALVVISWVAFYSTASAEAKVSVAVLPFEHYSGSPDEERLAARLTDAVSSELARLGSVAVVSRASARQFEGTRTALPVIAESLGAGLVIEGTLETVGGEAMVTVRIVDARRDRKIWADKFAGSAGDGTHLAARIATVVNRAIAER